MAKRISISTIASTVLLGAFLFTGCGSDGSSSGSSSISGVAIDGYLSGSKVCIDQNGDNECTTADTWQTTTNADGTFTLSGSGTRPSGKIIIYGGTDIDTNTTFSGILKAPTDITSGTINVTPLTTLITAKMEESNITVTQALANVGTDLNMTTADLTKNYRATNDVNVSKVAFAIQKIVEAVKTAVVSDSTTTMSTGAQQTATANIFKAFNSTALTQIKNVKSGAAVTISASDMNLSKAGVSSAKASALISSGVVNSIAKVVSDSNETNVNNIQKAVEAQTSTVKAIVEQVSAAQITASLATTLNNTSSAELSTALTTGNINITTFANTVAQQIITTGVTTVQNIDQTAINTAAQTAVVATVKPSLTLGNTVNFGSKSVSVSNGTFSADTRPLTTSDSIANYFLVDFNVTKGSNPDVNVTSFVDLRVAIQKNTGSYILVDTKAKVTYSTSGAVVMVIPSGTQVKVTSTVSGVASITGTATNAITLSDLSTGNRVQINIANLSTAFGTGSTFANYLTQLDSKAQKDGIYTVMLGLKGDGNINFSGTKALTGLLDTYNGISGTVGVASTYNSAPIVGTVQQTPSTGIDSNTTVTFIANPTDTDNDTLTYQWYVNGSAVSGATSPYYSAKFPASAQSVYVQVNDGHGGVVSSTPKTFTPVDATIAANIADVNATYNALTISSSVEANLTLATTLNGATISWASTNTSAISTNGTVTRGTTDQSVTLTATITKGSATQTKTFNVTVTAIPVDPLAGYSAYTTGNSLSVVKDGTVSTASVYVNYNDSTTFTGQPDLLGKGIEVSANGTVTKVDPSDISYAQTSNTVLLSLNFTALVNKTIKIDFGSGNIQTVTITSNHIQ